MQLKDNKTFKKAVVLVAVAALTGAVGVGLSAQMGPGRGADRQGPQGPCMMGGPGGPMGLPGFALRGLDLSDAQHEQLRAIAEKHRDALMASGEKVMDARRGLHDAVVAETPDEATIRQKAAELGTAEAAAAVLRATVRTEALSVLTPEQQQTMKERREKMEQHMKNGRERMREPIDERPLSESDQQDSGPQTV